MNLRFRWRLAFVMIERWRLKPCAEMSFATGLRIDLVDAILQKIRELALNEFDGRHWCFDRAVSAASLRDLKRRVFLGGVVLVENVSER